MRVDPLHEVLDHLLGDVEVADDAVAERADGDDAGRCPADHPLGLGPDRQDLLRLGVDRHHRRLAYDDPAIPDVDQGVRGPEVDPDVAGEEAEEAIEHDGGRVLRGLVGPVERCGSAAGNGRIARSSVRRGSAASIPAPSDHAAPGEAGAWPCGG